MSARNSSTALHDKAGRIHSRMKGSAFACFSGPTPRKSVIARARKNRSSPSSIAPSQNGPTSSTDAPAPSSARAAASTAARTSAVGFVPTPTSIISPSRSPRTSRGRP